MRFILASASPRRLELLTRAGMPPDVVIPADTDETHHNGELPVAYVSRVSLEKAQAIHTQHTDALVLAADTIVVCGRRILHKTEDAAVARAHLRTLSGRRHRVYTAVTLLAPAGVVHTRLVETRVHCARLTNALLDDYLASGEWRGVAGAYAIQGAAAAFIPWINGSFTNIIGLPLPETLGLLKRYRAV